MVARLLLAFISLIIPMKARNIAFFGVFALIFVRFGELINFPFSRQKNYNINVNLLCSVFICREYYGHQSHCVDTKYVNNVHDGIIATHFRWTSSKRAVIPSKIQSKLFHFQNLFFFVSFFLSQFPQWLWIILISQWNLYILAWSDCWMDSRYYTKLCDLFSFTFNNVGLMRNSMGNWIHLATNSFA